MQFALFAESIDVNPKITYTRRVPNKIAKILHKAIRPKLNLEKDYDPNTGDYLKQPDW